MFWLCLDNTSLCIDYPVEVAKLLYFSFWLHFAKSKGSVAETAVWPIPFLTDMLASLKGFQFYFYYVKGIICSSL